MFFLCSNCLHDIICLILKIIKIKLKNLINQQKRKKIEKMSSKLSQYTIKDSKFDAGSFGQIILAQNSKNQEVVIKKVKIIIIFVF